jgi:hypothetical protein
MVCYVLGGCVLASVMYRTRSRYRPEELYSEILGQCKPRIHTRWPVSRCLPHSGIYRIDRWRYTPPPRWWRGDTRAVRGCLSVSNRNTKCRGWWHRGCACAYRAVRQEDDGLAVGKIAGRSNVQGEKTQGNGAHGPYEGHDAGCGRMPDEAVFDFLRSKSAEEVI